MLSTLQRRAAARDRVLCPVVLAAVLAVLCVPASAAVDAQEEADYVEALAARELHDEVVREARAFLSEHAGHDSADRVRYRLAGSLEAKGESDAACSEYRKLTEDDEFVYVDAARLRFARCELNTGDSKASKRAAKLCELVAGDSASELRAPALLLAGEAWRRADEPARAVKALESLVQMERGAVSDKARFEAWHGLAAACFEVKDGEGALAAVQEARRLKGARKLELARIEARAFSLLERHAAAAQAFEELAENGKETTANRRIALREGAFCASRADDPGRAARLFDSLRAQLSRAKNSGDDSISAEMRSEQLAEAALQAGAHHFLAGDPRKARRSLREDVLARDVEATLWLTRAELADKDAKAARKTAENALRTLEIEDAKQREQLCLLLAQACDQLGDTAAAADARERSGSTAGAVAAAAAHLAQGRLDEAERAASGVAEESTGDSVESVTARWILAEVSFARRDFAPAEKRYERAKRGAPRERLDAIDARLAWCAYLGEDWSLAEQRFSELLERGAQSPELGDAREMRARCILEGARTDSSGEGRLARLLEEDGVPQAVALDGRRLLCSRLSGRGEHAAALPHFEALLQADASDVEAAYGLAAALVQTDQCARAAQVVEANYQRQAPDDLVERMIELGLFCATKEKDADTLRSLGLAWVSASKDEAACLERLRPAVHTLRELKGAQAALELWNRFGAKVKKAAVTREVALEIAWLELELGRVERAESLAKAALEGGAQGALMGDLCFALGEARFDAAPQLARAHYVNALERSGEIPAETAARCLYKLGFEAAARKDQVEAAQFFEKLGTAPEYRETALRGEALTLAGEAAYLAGDAKRASRLLKRQHDEFPRHETAPRALFRWAQAASLLENYDAALEALRELQRVAPKFEPAIECDFMRGRALARGDERGEARRALKRVVEADGSSGVFVARARIELGRLAEVEGDDEGALSEYLKVALLFGGDAEVCEALVRAGDVLQGRGDVDAARERWRECVERGAKKKIEWASVARKRLERPAK